MADKPMELRALRRAVTRYGGWEDSKRGKGAHTMFFRHRGNGLFSYPIPNRREVLRVYVKGLRERLGLTAADGVPDEDFYDS